MVTFNNEREHVLGSLSWTATDDEPLRLIWPQEPIKRRLCDVGLARSEQEIQDEKKTRDVMRGTKINGPLNQGLSQKKTLRK